MHFIQDYIQKSPHRTEAGRDVVEQDGDEDSEMDMEASDNRVVLDMAMENKNLKQQIAQL